MSDPRFLAANGRVAAEELRGIVEAERFVTGAARRIAAPLADVRHAPGGNRIRQWHRGQPVTVLEEHQGWAFARSGADGYVGYVASNILGPTDPAPDHLVIARSTHVYSAPNIKSTEVARLPVGAGVATGETVNGFRRLTSGGFVWAHHLRAWPSKAGDGPAPVTTARSMLGTPYLWGGDGPDGIDCSGLVHLAAACAGYACPADSDLQEAAFGPPLQDGDALAGGDLVFWRGHVGMMTGPETLIHANAYHMAVVEEPLVEAKARIEASGNGPVTSARRPPWVALAD